MLSYRRFELYFLSASLSLLLSLITISTHPSLNVDSTYYIETARVFTTQGLHAAVHVYSWPVYSIIIAYLSRLTGLSLLQAAYLQSIILSIFTVCLFINMVKLLANHSKLPWIAALVILLWQEFNGFRSDIIRDHGYWFFCMLGLYGSFSFVTKKTWTSALISSVGFLCATLYRIEGVILLLSMPIIITLMSKRKLKVFMKLTALPILVLFFVLVFISHPISFFIPMLTQHAGKNFHIYYYSSFIMYWPDLIKAFGIAYLLLLVYGLWRHTYACLDKSIQYCLIAYVLINFIISFSFYFTHGFLSNRYIMPMLLGLLLLIPFALLQLYQDWRVRLKNLSLAGLLFPLTLLLMFSMLVASVYPFGPSNRYIYQSAVWFDLHTHQATLYTNDARIAILSNHSDATQSAGWQPEMNNQLNWDKLKLQPWQNDDYAIFVIKELQQPRLQDLSQYLGQPVMVFENKRHQMAVIYKVKGN